MVGCLCLLGYVLVTSMSRTTITLFHGPIAWGIPNVSPFCTKLETYLRMAEISYQTKLGDPRKAPTGKIPYIELDGKMIGDSQRIIEALQRKLGDKTDAHLSAAERTRGHLIRRTLEEGTYFVLLYTRWCTEDGWKAYAPVFAPMLPPLIGGPVLSIIRSQVAKSVRAQGTGRQAPGTIYDMGKADFDAIAAELGDKPFLFGDNPSSFDAVLYAFTSGILSFPTDSPIKRHVATLANLVAHCERMQQRFFPPNRPPGRG